MNKLFRKLCLQARDFTDRDGAPDLIEYALILTLASLAIAGEVHKVTITVDALFANISNTLV